MDIRKFMKKSIFKGEVYKQFGQKISKAAVVLFSQHRLMREPQTYLMTVQVHFRLSCVNMRHFSKTCNSWQEVHLCGKFVYSST